MNRATLTLTGMAFILALTASHASATLMVTDLSASATSFAGARQNPIAAVGGRGLSGDSHTTNNWADPPTNSIPSMWHTAISTFDGSLFLDLKRNMPLQQTGTLKIWNYNGLGPGNDFTFRGLRQVTFATAPDDGGSVIVDTDIPSATFTAVANPTIKQDDGTVVTELTRAPNSSGYNTPDVVDFNEALNVRYIRITKVTDQGADVAVGLAEVQVFAPEPASAVLLASGLFALLRRSRR